MRKMDFQSAAAYLGRFKNYAESGEFSYEEDGFDLRRFGDMAKRFGFEAGKLKCVHVAGSKGKGSVCGMVAEYLRRRGMKVGLFLSPFLLHEREACWAGGELITQDQFIEYVERLRDFIEGEDVRITYFEALTLMVLKYFQDQGVEYAVVEVGLGGRLDATNIVEAEVCGLSLIEKEHTKILGESYEEIVGEKLGIVKGGEVLVVGRQKELVEQVVKKQLESIKLKEVLYFDDYYELIELSDEDRGKHSNGLMAFKILEVLLGGVDQELFRGVFDEFKMIGRMDVREVEGKWVVFDMAHTASSIKNLLETLERRFEGKRLVFLVSFLKDKAVEEMLEMIEEVADKVYLVGTGQERGIEADLDPIKTHKKALAELKLDEVLVVTGSHYLIKLLLARPV